MTETQQRFLRAIAERVPRDQVVEVHLFPAIRQGGVETGVAVVAEDPRPVAMPQADGASDVAPVTGSPEMPPNADTNGSVDARPEEFADESEVAADADSPRVAEEAARKFTIHTARYRLTLKGVDRGKWDFDVVAEADAPLEAVDAVVRGVQRRAGEGTEPDRLTTAAFREALDAPLAQLER